MLRQPNPKLKHMTLWILAFVLLTSCGGNKSGSTGTTPPADFSGGGSIGSSTDDGGAADLNEALNNIPQNNQAQTDAVQNAQGVVGNLSQAYQALRNDPSGNGAFSFQRFLALFQQGLPQAIQRMRDAGLGAYVPLLESYEGRFRVNRCFNPVSEKYTYISAVPQSARPSENLAGDSTWDCRASFGVYSTPQLFNARTGRPVAEAVAIYRCFATAGAESFISNSQNCENLAARGATGTLLGYISSIAGTNTPAAARLGRVFYPTRVAPTRSVHLSAHQAELDDLRTRTGNATVQVWHGYSQH